jgi:diadenosine tetraphosphate (Ap4A) HIT family hydrolase
MVIPKKHRRGFGDFTPEERNDAMLLIGQYETMGYNVYARGVDSPSRSVEHQHTHLIKLYDKPSKLVIYSEKPYVLIDF